MDPELSIIIPTYDRRALLARCLATVFEQSLAPDRYEVIVVVDGSTDGTVEYLRSLTPRCRLVVIEQPRNMERAVARNTGIEAARGRVVLFVDDDLLCDRGMAAAHLAAHADGAPLVAFGPVRTAPSSPSTLIADWARSQDGWIAGIEADLEPRWPTHASIDANYSVTSSLLRETGGYDTQFVVREAADLGLRLWGRGVPYRYLPAARAQHVYAKPERVAIVEDARAFGAEEVRLCRKHPSYRPVSPLAQLFAGGPLEHRVRAVVATLPFSLGALLEWPARAAGAFRAVPSLRRLALRLLYARNSIELLRAAVRATGSWRAFEREFGQRLPVLMYHHVGPRDLGEEAYLSVPPERFAEQIEWLTRNGYRAITPADWLAWQQTGKALPPKPVLITFDDAYADLAEHAFPVLERHGQSATVFVVTERLGGTNDWDSGDVPLMSEAQIREWSARGIEFGAHTTEHRDLRALAVEELESELARTRDQLSRVTGRAPTAFAYPWGRYDDVVVAAVRRHFDIAFTTDVGMNVLGTDPHGIHRINVPRSDPLWSLSRQVRAVDGAIERARRRFRIRTRLRAGRRALAPR